MKLKKTEVEELMLSALSLRGISETDAKFIIDDYVESELEGHKTHGLSKFLMIDAAISEKTTAPKIIKEAGCFSKIDGGGELGHLGALQAVNKGIDLAKTHGIGLVSLSNISRYSRITPYARKVAKEGFIGILMNNGGPAIVAPFGGSRAIFGTNPLCFAFPGKDKPYIFDFATSQKVWGEVRQAIVEQRPLTENSFIDCHGHYTTDPYKAEAGVPFGGPKGYALCYAIEVLTGAFIGAKMGLDPENEFDLGYLFMILSPEMFTTLEDFINEMEKMAEDVRHSTPVDPKSKVFVPGEIFGGKPVSLINENEMDIDDDVYQRLNKMSISLEGGYENDRRFN